MSPASFASILNSLPAVVSLVKNTVDIPAVDTALCIASATI